MDTQPGAPSQQQSTIQMPAGAQPSAYSDDNDVFQCPNCHGTVNLSDIEVHELLCPAINH